MNKEEKIEKVKKFIKENELDFNSTDSGLNSNCTILSGYLLHLNFTSLSKDIKKLMPNSIALKELARVFKYAKANNYGAYWSGKHAKSMYHF